MQTVELVFRFSCHALLLLCNAKTHFNGACQLIKKLSYIISVLSDCSHLWISTAHSRRGTFSSPRGKICWISCAYSSMMKFYNSGAIDGFWHGYQTFAKVTTVVLSLSLPFGSAYMLLV